MTTEEDWRSSGNFKVINEAWLIKSFVWSCDL